MMNTKTLAVDTTSADMSKGDMVRIQTPKGSYLVRKKKNNSGSVPCTDSDVPSSSSSLPDGKKTQILFMVRDGKKIPVTASNNLPKVAAKPTANYSPDSVPKTEDTSVTVKQEINDDDIIRGAVAEIQNSKPLDLQSLLNKAIFNEVPETPTVKAPVNVVSLKMFSRPKEESSDEGTSKKVKEVSKGPAKPGRPSKASESVSEVPSANKNVKWFPSQSSRPVRKMKRPGNFTDTFDFECKSDDDEEEEVFKKPKYEDFVDRKQVREMNYGKSPCTCEEFMPELMNQFKQITSKLVAFECALKVLSEKEELNKEKDGKKLEDAEAEIGRLRAELIARKNSLKPAWKPRSAM